MLKLRWVFELQFWINIVVIGKMAFLVLHTSVFHNAFEQLYEPLQLQNHSKTMTGYMHDENIAVFLDG